MASDSELRAARTVVGSRTLGREAALQMLYAKEASGNSTPEVITAFWRETPSDAEGREYGDDLVRGVLGELETVDEWITKCSDNWRIERMARVDRNVLRIAAYELLRVLDVPRSVALDEAVNLAKKYGSEDSGKFVNGVLSRVANELGRVDTDR
jgi:transcription antitermination protein NusB